MRITKIHPDPKNGVNYTTVRELPKDYLILVTPIGCFVEITDDHTIRVR